MTIDRATVLFFDASCLIAAAGSPSGGSGFLLMVCARGYLTAAASQPVLLEAERNIRDKLGREALARYRELLITTPMRIAPVPAEADRELVRGVINEKDEHGIASALAAGATFLITLDRGLAAEVTEAGLPLQDLSPGDFIRTLLPTHTDYPSVRD